SCASCSKFHKVMHISSQFGDLCNNASPRSYSGYPNDSHSDNYSELSVILTSKINSTFPPFSIGGLARM
ncbi:MAG: hypothetical protein VB138_08445, partial [Burkholderia sp.]